MAVTEITEIKDQYSKATEVMCRNKAENSKPYGIKMPDSGNIIAVLPGLFVITVVSSIMFGP